MLSLQRLLNQKIRKDNCSLTVILWLSCLILFSGCSHRIITNHPDKPQQWLKRFGIQPPTFSAINTCTHIGCQQTSLVTISSTEWERVTALFSMDNHSPQEERQTIAKAVGYLEEVIGNLNGTSNDIAKNGFTMKSGQLDCIAEATNSTVYLLLFEQHGLLRYHKVVKPAHRGIFQLRGPHNTAVIYSYEEGQYFAVDSWFFKNGEPAVVVELTEWINGYSP